MGDSNMSQDILMDKWFKNGRPSSQCHYVSDMAIPLHTAWKMSSVEACSAAMRLRFIKGNNTQGWNSTVGLWIFEYITDKLHQYHLNRVWKQLYGYFPTFVISFFYCLMCVPFYSSVFCFSCLYLSLSLSFTLCGCHSRSSD